jgi:hypothetical protein
VEDYTNDLLENVQETVEKEINEFCIDFEAAMLVMEKKSLKERIDFADDFRNATMLGKTNMIHKLIGKE